MLESNAPKAPTVQLNVRDHAMPDNFSNAAFSRLNEEFLEFGNWHWHPDTGALTWSHGMYVLMDFDLHEQVPQVSPDMYRSFIFQGDRDNIKDSFDQAVLHRQKSAEFKHTVMTVLQNTKIFHSRISIEYDNNGKVTHVLGITRDITESTRMINKYEHDLNEKILELDRLGKELEDSAYAASHDLQEPLRKISTLSDRLQDKFNEVLPEDGKKYIERIQVASRNARVLIDSLLEFSRITNELQTFKEADLFILLEEVKSDLELRIEETHTTINCNKLDSLEVSAPQIKQLFSNLILNSIKFKRDGVMPVIDIKGRLLDKQEVQDQYLDPETPHYLITIQDNGIGFEEEYATKIFQMFSRLNGKSEYPGAGIGLAICKKIAESHKGKIFATSILGEGSLFSVILPKKHHS